MYCLLVLSIVVVVVASMAVAGTASPPSALRLRGMESTADSIAASALERGPLAGMSVAVAHAGRVVFAKGYGVADLASRRPVTTETVFPLCSISKHIAAAAVLKLTATHHLRLSDTVGDLLPEAPRAWGDITLRQLLTHTSGLANYNDPALGWDSLQTRPLSHDQVMGLVRDLPLAFTAGTSWGYSNTAFYLIGMLIERLCGRSYGDYVHDVVGAPLGAPSMRAVSAVDLGSRARGYQLSGDSLVEAEREDWSNPFAAGGLAATARDLAEWESRESRGTAYAAMLAPTRLVDGETIDYGLGTRLGRFEKHRVAGHTGTGNGFNNVVVNYRDDDVIIVVLTNSESRIGARSIAAGIARHVLRLPAATSAADLPVPSAVAAADTGAWIGDSGAIEVFATGDRLHWRRLGEPGEGHSLSYEGDGSFRIRPGMLARFGSVDGHARWTQVYVEGMFDEAEHRLR